MKPSASRRRAGFGPKGLWVGCVLIVSGALAGAAPAPARVHHGPKPARLRAVAAAELAVADGEVDVVPEAVPNRLIGPGGGAAGRPEVGSADRRLVPTRTGDGFRAAGDAAPPAIDRRFDGPYHGGLYPPDPVMAAGSDHVVVLINQRIAMYDKSGTLLSGPTSLGAFFGIPSGFSRFDPLAVYDPFEDRFIVTALADNGGAQDSRIYIAFSQSADPTGSWNTYWIDADDGQAGNWADYASIGIDRNAVYLTANMWDRGDNFRNVTIFIYDKADGYAGLPLDNTHLIDVRTSGGGVPFVLRPATVVDVVAGDEYFLAHVNNSFGSSLDLFRLSGDRFASPTLTTQSVALPALYFAPGSARQSGGASVTARDAQLWNVYYRGGKLFTAQAVSGSDITCWVHRIDVSADPAVRQQTYEISEAGYDAFMPYVLPDREDDDFALLTAWSGPDIFVGARYWNFAADGTLRGAEAVVDGTRANTSGRHGDYHAIGEDPLDTNRLWMIAQYMKNSSLAGNQLIASVRFEDQPPPASPPPVPDGRSVAGTQLTVIKATGGELTVDWDAGACPADGHHIVWYDLAQIAGYVVVDETCDIGTSGTWTGPPPGGGVGLVVVADDAAGDVEGSHGSAADGSERSSRSTICRTIKDTAGTCAP
ncbi:MAG: hypothetical protein Q9Q40_14060 [Acidobacteriota bacterium]|nr:hypothetical protein [Acidobacteriota bacterium]MDQ7086905.1 hypothetical protein [Acidobacteriota bacterium]